MVSSGDEPGVGMGSGKAPCPSEGTNSLRDPPVPPWPHQTCAQPTRVSTMWAYACICICTSVCMCVCVCICAFTGMCVHAVWVGVRVRVYALHPHPAKQPLDVCSLMTRNLTQIRNQCPFFFFLSFFPY